MKQKDIIADLHTHTVFSKHAYSTLKENLTEGKKMGMQYVAVTDHVYLPNDEMEMNNFTTRIGYQGNEKSNDGITIIGGAEFNLNQELPLTEKWLKAMWKLKWKPIGLHSWFVDLRFCTLNNIYNLYMKEILTGEFHALVHIEREIEFIEQRRHRNLDDETKLFLSKLVVAAKEHDMFLEVNESSLKNGSKTVVQAMEYWLSLAKSYGCKLCLGTDSHYCDSVGDFERCIKMLNKVDYPKDLILNCDPDWLKELFG